MEKSIINYPVCKILSFDGGGIRGLFQAGFLKKIENQNPVDRCDVLIGTSTGAIIAVALARGLSPTRILELYRNMGEKLFSKKTGLATSLFRGAPRYSSKVLGDILQNGFGPAKLGDCSKRTMICAVRFTDSSLKVFDSQEDSSLSIVDVLLASTAAPTYFKEHTIGNQTYMDGGIAANNPSLEAVRIISKSFSHKKIRILSVGNGKSVKSRLRSTLSTRIGYAMFARDMFGTLLDLQSETVHLHCQSLLGKSNYIRINKLYDKLAELDDYDTAEGLAGDGERVAEENKDAIVAWFK